MYCFVFKLFACHCHKYEGIENDATVGLYLPNAAIKMLNLDVKSRDQKSVSNCNRTLYPMQPSSLEEHGSKFKYRYLSSNDIVSLSSKLCREKIYVYKTTLSSM